MEMWLTTDPPANELLTENSFALLLGMQLDQQVPMEKAFRGPYDLALRMCAAGRCTRVGELCAELVTATSEADLVALFQAKPALHRFPEAMAKRARQLSVLLCDRYCGDAARLWDGVVSGEQLLARLRDLPGFGDGKSRVFLALLGKQLGVRPAGWREASKPFGEEGSMMSVADITDSQSLSRVREYKKAAKQQAKQIRGSS